MERVLGGAGGRGDIILPFSLSPLKFICLPEMERKGRGQLEHRDSPKQSHLSAGSDIRDHLQLHPALPLA